MTPIPDYHLHTSNTDDGTAALLEMAGRAAEIGLGEIAITDHYLHGVQGYCVTPVQIERHFSDAEIAERRFGVKVLVGLEADYFPQIHDKLEKLFASFDFDIILGAAHIVDGFGLASEGTAKAFFARNTPVECYRKSLARVAEAARSGLFDVMAHLDIAKKFGVGLTGGVAFEEYADAAGDVAKALRESGAGFEVNCRGFEHSAREQYPSLDFMKELKRNGVEKVTAGSDAHTLADVGTYLDRGLGVLREAGFDSICRFRRRRHEFVAIEELLT